MAKAKEDVAVLDSPAATTKPDFSGNDPNKVYDEVMQRREELQNRTYGTHRWRVAFPNYAHYIYYECEFGQGQEMLAKASYHKTIGTSIPPHLEKLYEFVYEGKVDDLGPAPYRHKIPLNKRKVTWKKPPKR